MKYGACKILGNVRRIYVERKNGFDLEAKGLFDQCITLLGIKELERVRIFNRYDIQGLDDSIYAVAKYGIFAEIQTDIVYEEELEGIEGGYLFAYEYLPGQYDQRADSTEQCIQLISHLRPIVKTARVICLYGNIHENNINTIKQYIINPVECRIAKMQKPKDLSEYFVVPERVDIVSGFIKSNVASIQEMRHKCGFAMSSEDLLFVKQYFESIGRDPTITELKVIDTYWSDHCRHTTFNTVLSEIKIDKDIYNETCEYALEKYKDIRKELYKDREKDLCLMDIATIGAKYLKSKGMLLDMEDTKENNACSIVLEAPINDSTEKWLVMFKNETHNHPTEIEPFGGAATCLGGAIRDPLSGRSYVYQAMRVTGAGNPFTKVEDTIAGKLPQIKIIREAANGYSSYGNQVGLATGLVDEVYHEGYVAKRMEIGAVIAAAPLKNVRRCDPKTGDAIILIGGRTGRDGLGGATGSSKTHTEESLENCGAEVQKGNAPTERKIQRLFRNPKMSRLIKKCNDFGAGGVAVAIGELAEGLDIYLDNIPKKYEGLDGTELAISESQERMAVVIDKNDISQVLKLAEEENLEATLVAVVTNTKHLRMFWNDRAIVDIERSFLDTNGVKQYAEAHITKKDESKNPFIHKSNKSKREQLFESVSDLNTCSKKGLIEKFDSTIGSSTVLMPLGGIYQITPTEAMAAKLPVLNGKTDYCTLMAYGFFPQISEWSCFTGACYSVLSSVAKIVSAGGDYSNIRLTFQEYFESLRKDPKRWGKPLQALLGALYTQLELNMPAIGGKDSMSGSFMDMDVVPTLVSFAVSHTNAKNVLSPEFKKPDSTVIRFSHRKKEDMTPDFKNSLLIFEAFKELSIQECILSASTIKHKGASEALSKMCFGNMIGFELLADPETLFTPGYCDILTEIDSDKVPDISAILNKYKDIDISVTGKTIEKPLFVMKEDSVTLDELLKAYTDKYEPVFTTQAATQRPEITNGLYKSKNIYYSRTKTASPKVFIPVFPGTNCEYDTKRAFEEQKAVCSLSVFRNLAASHIDDSVKEFVKNINEANIIAIPGGFSAGDEPDGSGKFIATVFRNSYIKEAVHEMLYNRDGLILGICNGFQALIKLGLVPYGKITELHENSPTLTFNSIGRHISCMANTKVVSKLSPWFACANLDEVYTIPVSHGEGRFICTKEEYEKLSANGQIATQYVDDYKKPSYDIRYNPNGSYYAIEGITSADGRILGKMGHSERIGKFVAKNIPGNKDQLLFASGVKYFR
ncbi:MAG: phosphoribosylformylglycinamidine synthase [Clostridia bacterium]|nr:phosphoribosylformylglycinamidine synthase [Clostridia bacterium]NLV33173.1 phosphoribosylformylglycinamidine synthase [Clostridiaceae bacterium]HQM96475.1 phosphoribosylformylglycinamidine synthase [Clostridia bacterium]